MTQVEAVGVCPERTIDPARTYDEFSGNVTKRSRYKPEHVSGAHIALLVISRQIDETAAEAVRRTQVIEPEPIKNRPEQFADPIVFAEDHRRQLVKQSWQIATLYLSGRYP